MRWLGRQPDRDTASQQGDILVPRPLRRFPRQAREARARGSRRRVHWRPAARRAKLVQAARLACMQACVIRPAWPPLFRRRLRAHLRPLLPQTARKSMFDRRAGLAARRATKKAGAKTIAQTVDQKLDARAKKFIAMRKAERAAARPATCETQL